MASPLRKRFPRELKNNLGKYLGIFLLMSVTIALTSGFLLAAHSIGVIIDDMPEKYSIEDARFTTAFEATDEQLDQMLAEDQSQVTTIDAYKEKARRAVKCCDDFPLLVYTADETAERASLLADIQTYIKTMKAQFIIGETDIDSNWDTFINTLNGMRLQRLLEIEQQAYDRYAKNL